MQPDIIVIYEISFRKVSVVAIVDEDRISFDGTSTVVKWLIPANLDRSRGCWNFCGSALHWRYVTSVVSADLWQLTWLFFVKVVSFNSESVLEGWLKSCCHELSNLWCLTDRVKYGMEVTAVTIVHVENVASDSSTWCCAILIKLPAHREARSVWKSIINERSWGLRRRWTRCDVYYLTIVWVPHHVHRSRP